MIEGLKPYSSYRASPAPWMGRLPQHWMVERGKALFSESHVPVRDRDDVVTCFRDGQVTLRTNRRTRGFMLALHELGYQGVRRGQLVIHAMDAFAGAIGVSDSDGKCTPEYIVCNPRSEGTRPAYFAQVLRLAAHQGFILASCPAVRERAPRFRYPHFGAMLLPVPSPDEQSAIVRFLNHANRRIDGYIRGKRKLIALLNEQKQAIIHRAVTRGFDPSVAMKDSGVPWLGEIPAHWEVLPLKRLSGVISKGTTPSTEGRDTLDAGPVRFLKAENISGGIIANVPKFFVDDETHSLLKRSQLKEGDVLFVIAGATLGKTAVVRATHLPANTNQAVAFIRPSARVMPDFVALWLQSPRVREQVWLNAVQSAQPNLAMGSLGQFQTPVPPNCEQALILRSVHMETATQSAAVEQTEREIALMREYRTRLVSDVVTGQLDVRDAARGLPDVEPENDTLATPELDEEGEAEEAFEGDEAA